jgi:hypothetical protein
MRIIQPRYTCSDLLALDSVMEDHLRRESTRDALGTAGVRELGERQFRLSARLARRLLDPDGVRGSRLAELRM